MVVLFQRRGIVTMLLHELVGTPLVTWYARPPYAFILVVFVLIWTQVGFFTVLYLAGLQNIGKDVYEAAAVDGAGARQRFRYVTVPLLRPTSFLVVVIGIIVTLQVFEQPFVLSTTGGALPGSPGDSTLTMVMYLYTEAFRYFDMGIAAAAALVIFVVIVPRNVRLSEAPSFGKPILLYDVTSQGSQAYLGLARAILERDTTPAQADKVPGEETPTENASPDSRKAAS